MKKPILKLLVLLFLCSIYSISFSQNHYVVTIDRINDNSKKYEVLTFKNGRPITREINGIPSVKKGDLITIKLINFNELIYGFEIKNNLVGKPKSFASQLIQDNPITKAIFSSSPAALLFSTLLQTPPSGVDGSRGTDDKYSLVKEDIKDGYNVISKKIITSNERLKWIIEEDGEGTTKKELLDNINELKINYNPYQIKESLIEIKDKIEKIPNGDRGAEINYLYSNIEKLLTTDENYFTYTESSLSEIESIIKSVDFQVEKTVIVGRESNPESVENNWSNKSMYEKFSTEVVIYKRASPILTADKIVLTKTQYNFFENEKNGDDIRQVIDVDFKIKYKNRLYWTASILEVVLPSDKYNYAINENMLQDSFAFKNHALGFNRIAIGLEINYDLPYDLKYFTTSASIGVAASLSNNKVESGSDLPIDKTYITTSMGIKFKKYSFCAIKIGAVWSKYQELKKEYKSDFFYSNSFINEDQRNNAISKRIIPSFFVGLSFNL